MEYPGGAWLPEALALTKSRLADEAEKFSFMNRAAWSKPCVVIPRRIRLIEVICVAWGESTGIVVP